MAMDELIAYVVLLSLPLWLLVEQLLFIRTRGRTTRDQVAREQMSHLPEPRREAESARRAPAAFRGPLRSSQR